MSKSEKYNFRAAMQGASMSPDMTRIFLVNTCNSLLEANGDNKRHDDTDFYVDAYVGRLFDGVDEVERMALPSGNGLEEIPPQIPVGGLMNNARSGMRWQYGDPELHGTDAIYAPRELDEGYLAMSAVERVNEHATKVYEQMYPDATVKLMGDQ